MTKTAELSTAFEPGSLVWIPLPFVEQPRLRLRPALIWAMPIASGEMALAWTMMVTSKLLPAWPGDVVIGDRHGECGLPVPSLVRTAKIAASDLRGARLLGRLPEDLFAVVRREICGFLRWP